MKTLTLPTTPISLMRMRVQTVTMKQLLDLVQRNHALLKAANSPLAIPVIAIRAILMYMYIPTTQYFFTYIPHTLPL